MTHLTGPNGFPYCGLVLGSGYQATSIDSRDVNCPRCQEVIVLHGNPNASKPQGIIDAAKIKPWYPLEQISKRVDNK